MEINKDTKLCISLSSRPSNFGVRFQNFLFQKLNLNYLYKSFSIEDIAGALMGMRALGIRGSAVSMPFKEKCIEYLDELDSFAGEIKSVNTIVNNNAVLKGYNTDYLAVLNLLKTHNIPNSTQFTLFGSGGMAKAVLFALKNSGFTNGVILSRNKDKGEHLAKEYHFKWQEKILDAPEFIINTTPIGMSGGNEVDKLSFSEDVIKKAKYVFDVVALPVETPLVKLALSLNKKVITGGDVVILQAVEQFELYTGVRPSSEQIQNAADFAINIQI